MNQVLKGRSLAGFVITIALVLVMAGCGGGSSNNSSSNNSKTVATVLLFPNPSISLTSGQVIGLAAEADNAAGKPVFSETITFASSDPHLQIANNGLLCAGTWDSLTSPVV